MPGRGDFTPYPLLTANYQRLFFFDAAEMILVIGPFSVLTVTVSPVLKAVFETITLLSLQDMILA